MNGLRKNFRLPQGGAEHHQIYASINVRKILDTTTTRSESSVQSHRLIGKASI